MLSWLERDSGFDSTCRARQTGFNSRSPAVAKPLGLALLAMLGVVDEAPLVEELLLPC